MTEILEFILTPMTPHTPYADDVTIICSTTSYNDLKKTFASLIVMRGNDIGKQFKIKRQNLVIGRIPSAGIMLKDKQISRSHAEIRPLFVPREQETVYKIVDLNSTNHLYVNGHKVREHVLRHDDKIRIGDTILKFSIQDEIEAKYHSAIQKKIEYDDLTSLLTYESFTSAMSWEIDNAREHRNKFCVIMMDLDDFKKVNDNHGHLMGSYVLSEIGHLIKNSLRQFDISARYGGEEFIAYLPETGREESETAAERLRAAIEKNIFSYQGDSLHITISMGISEFPENGRKLNALIAAADKALYKAKKDGKNRICLCQA